MATIFCLLVAQLIGITLLLMGLEAPDSPIRFKLLGIGVGVSIIVYILILIGASNGSWLHI